MGLAFVAKRRASEPQKKFAFAGTGSNSRSNVLFAVIADGFDRTTLHSLLAERFFLGAFGLFIHVSVTTIIIPREIGGRGLAT
jgi:hypothetical protein